MHTYLKDAYAVHNTLDKIYIDQPSDVSIIH